MKKKKKLVGNTQKPDAPSSSMGVYVPDDSEGTTTDNNGIRSSGGPCFSNISYKKTKKIKKVGE